ncbi:MAG: site-2 protease family protein [Actinobacteria bacterium]|nr:MAG: site-2 protease family protein [Actinomycetota bacterium]
MADAQDDGQSGSGLRFRLFGMPVRVPLSGLAGVALVAWLWTPTFSVAGSGVWAAIVFALGLYASILAHELAHGLTARGLGHGVRGITLWILGGFTVYERAGLTAMREGLIAASGPLTTLGVAGLCELGANLLLGQVPGVVVVVLKALAWTNLLLGILNLLPGLPLDGGGIVRAAVWGLTGSEYRGTVVAAWFGRIIALVCVGVPLGLALGGRLDLVNVLVACVFGVFVWVGATASLRAATFEAKIPGLQAGALARRAVPARGPESLALAEQRMTQAQAGAIVVVDDDGRPTGVVDATAAAATPADRRPWVTVGALATPLPAAAVSAALSGEDLVAALQAAGAPAVLVHDGAGAIYGVLFIADVEQALA